MTSGNVVVVVKGGVKFFSGNAAAARTYLERDCARADDYYLREGTGLAERVVATSLDGHPTLQPRASMDGDVYERWVAGYDVDTGAPMGQLRQAKDSLRFVEVVVNGPKSWSLAAALHPDVSAAYDVAQSAAAQQIITWLTAHATTRVGGRGRQVQVPVERLEAAVVRHYTSRAGDPHRHLHLQVNARVYAAGKWRGLHSVAVRNSLGAIHGIGHAAVMTHPGFRQALAGHGYTLDPATGEIHQLHHHVRAFSARATQINHNIDTYEAAWRAEHPGQEPGHRLRRTWDRRAWAEDRPDKPGIGDEGRVVDLEEQWRDQLTAAGHQGTALGARRLFPTPVGEVDRQAAVEVILTRLGATRSAWSPADIRGQAEQIIAELNIITEAAVRAELAEDLTARAITQGHPLIDPDRVPQDLRYLTSRHVLNIEADLIARLSARGNQPVQPGISVPGTVFPALDTGQRLVVQALTGTTALVVVEGAAGAGKTATLAAANRYLGDLARMVIVAPTLNAAQVAQDQVHTTACTAHALAHAYGFRWDDDGAWTRTPAASVDSLLRLLPGDLLVVDEAAMLDQDTAHALLVIADETSARLALIGDRHQLPAVGRGGLLDHAVTYVHPDAHLTMDTIHRFTDPHYANLSLLMRTSTHPEQVFDTLHTQGLIHIHPSDVEAITTLAAASITGALVTADTTEQVTRINTTAHTHRRDNMNPGLLVGSPGRAWEEEGVITGAGEWITAGDPVVTRRNDPALDVANRQHWTVTAIHPDQSLTVTSGRGQRTLPASYVREHVQLGYASTVYGAQGRTVEHAHLLLTDTTTAAAAYVAMTRGRHTNTAHIIADTITDARAQWIAAFNRDRADLGPAHAAALAHHDLDRYGWAQPPPPPRTPSVVRPPEGAPADRARRMPPAPLQQQPPAGPAYGR